MYCGVVNAFALTHFVSWSVLFGFCNSDLYRLPQLGTEVLSCEHSWDGITYVKGKDHDHRE
jgi:hypothetical protein